jgi:hypothetical protein
MEIPELRTIDLLMPLFRHTPPWLVMSMLVGLVSSSAFFLVAGRGFRSLPTYLLLGVAVAPLIQAAGSDLPALPTPLVIGEVHLAFAGAGTLAFLTLARLLRL